MAWSRLPGLPYRLLLRTTFDSVTAVTTIHAPLLVVRGSSDQEVPPEQSGRVFDAAPGPKQLVTIEGAGHDLRGPAGPTVGDVVATFLADSRSSAPA